MRPICDRIRRIGLDRTIINLVVLFFCLHVAYSPLFYIQQEWII